MALVVQLSNAYMLRVFKVADSTHDTTTHLLDQEIATSVGEMAQCFKALAALSEDINFSSQHPYTSAQLPVTPSSKLPLSLNTTPDDSPPPTTFSRVWTDRQNRKSSSF